MTYSNHSSGNDSVLNDQSNDEHINMDIIEIRILLDDTIGIDFYKKYLIKINMIEIYLCWSDIYSLKMMSSSCDIENKIKKIINTYVKSDSLFRKIFIGKVTVFIILYKMI